MEYISLFRMPTPVKITGRSSTITNSFVNSIVPVIKPSNEQVKTALDILGMDHDSFECSYCGAEATEWDHLRPLVLDKKPTGYISEIHNLVPSCGKCNQSKGNKPWATWLISNAKLSPKSKGVLDIDQRMQKLKEFENWEDPIKLDFESIVGTEKWTTHWGNCEDIQSIMRQAQELASEINKTIAEAYNKL